MFDGSYSVINVMAMHSPVTSFAVIDFKCFLIITARLCIDHVGKGGCENLNISSRLNIVILYINLSFYFLISDLTNCTLIEYHGNGNKNT